MPDDRSSRAEARANRDEDYLRKDIKDIKDQLVAITKQLKSVDKKVNEQADKINRIEEVCKECKNMRQEMKELQAENLIFKMKIKNIELYQEKQQIKKKRNWLEIYGIPAIEKESRVGILIDLAKEAKVRISEEDIEEEYRAKAVNGKERPIAIKMKNAQIRDNLVKQIKKIKPRLKNIGMEPENRYIFVNEALIPSRKNLLYKVKGEARDRNWKSVWTYKGDIYIKKEENGVQIRIETEDDLITLIK